MTMAPFNNAAPAENSSRASAPIRTNFAALFSGDFSPLRPRAQNTADMSIHIDGTDVESFWRQTWIGSDNPLNYAGGNSSAISAAPTVDPRIDLLTINSAGVLTWTVGSENSSPSPPSFPVGEIPICWVYCKTTMTKVVNYEDAAANPNEGYIYRDLRPLMSLSTGAWGSDQLDNQRQKPIISCDFLTANNYAFAPWAAFYYGNGSMNIASNMESNHPGMVYVFGSNTDDGVAFRTSSSIIIEGGEVTEFVFKTPSTFTNRLIRLGLANNWIAANHQVAFMFSNSANAYGRCTKSSNSSSTNNYALNSSTWYKARISVNNNASQVTFMLYAANGTQLFSESLNSNIPTADMSHGAGFFTPSDSGGIYIGYIDYMALAWGSGRTLTR